MVVVFSAALCILQSDSDLEKMAPVTVKPTEVHIREVLRSLLNERDLQYSISPAAAQEGSIELENVPFTRALTLILRLSDSGYRMSNGRLLVESLHEYQSKDSIGRYPSSFQNDELGVKVSFSPTGLEPKSGDLSYITYQWMQERAKQANLPVDSVMFLKRKQTGLGTSIYGHPGFAFAFPLMHIGHDGRPLKGIGRFNNELRTAGLHYDFFASALEPPQSDTSAVIGIVMTAEAEGLKGPESDPGVKHPSQRTAEWVGKPIFTLRFYEARPRRNRQGFRFLEKGERGFDPVAYLIALKLLNPEEIQN